MYEIYAERSPNVYKVTICLAELGAAWRDIWLDVTRGAQHEAAFHALTPNGRIPVLIDAAPADGGAPLTIWESGAILFYLAEKTGRFLPRETRARTQVMTWLFWQMAGLGPMSGQNAHFTQYNLAASSEYAFGRYRTETLRLYTVLDKQLAGRDWIADEYSIADMASYPWVRVHKFLGHDLEELPRLAAWRDRMQARPAVAEAYRRMDELPQGSATLEERYQTMLPERALAAVRAS